MTISGDETWIYPFDPEGKQQQQQKTTKTAVSSVCVVPGESLFLMCKDRLMLPGRSVACFTTAAFQDRRTVNTDWYHRPVSLSALPQVLQRPCQRLQPQKGHLPSCTTLKSAHTEAETMIFPTKTTGFRWHLSPTYIHLIFLSFCYFPPTPPPSPLPPPSLSLSLSFFFLACEEST